MAQSVYDTKNCLEEFIIIGGENIILEFECYDENNTPIVLSGAGITWKASEYGNPTNVLISKTGTITGSNTAEIELLEADTLSLSGKFHHQPVMIDSTNKKILSYQGIFTIIPRIQEII